MAASDAPFIFIALIAPFLAAAVCACADAADGALGGVASGPGACGDFCLLLPGAWRRAAGQAVTGGYLWVPSFNVSYSWLIDGLSLTFVLLISGIGALILLYAGGYLKGHPQQGRFFSFILMFMGSMLGVVVSTVS